jgi:hypothetical protein
MNVEDSDDAFLEDALSFEQGNEYELGDLVKCYTIFTQLNFQKIEPTRCSRRIEWGYNGRVCTGCELTFCNQCAKNGQLGTFFQWYCYKCLRIPPVIPKHEILIPPIVPKPKRVFPKTTKKKWF